MSKSTDLLKAIQSGHFPIILSGPTGVGKTHALLSATKALGLVYRYVDISQSRINRPLQSSCITHTVLYRLQDLENVRYTGNLVVETELHGVREKLPGSTEIRMGRQEFKVKKKIRHAKYEERSENLDVFRFIGRVFYKKLGMSEIERGEGRVYYRANRTAIESRPSNRTAVESKSSDRTAIESKPSNRTVVNRPSDRTVMESKLSDRSAIESKPSNIQANTINYRRFIIDESSSISFEEDHIFTSSVEEISASPPDFMSKCISFPANKIEAFLYANFPYFVGLNDLPQVYECLSLTGLSEVFLESYIGAILVSKAPKQKRFFSFRVESPLESKPNIDRWQYKFSE